MHWLAMLTSTHTDAHLFNLKNAKTLQSLLPTHSKQKKKKKKHKKQKEKKSTHVSVICIRQLSICLQSTTATIKTITPEWENHQKQQNVYIFFFYLFFNVHSSLELISHPQNFDVVSSQFLWFHLDLSHTHTKSCANKTTKARLCL